jgi:hypothetical protein
MSFKVAVIQLMINKLLTPYCTLIDFCYQICVKINNSIYPKIGDLFQKTTCLKIINIFNMMALIIVFQSHHLINTHSAHNHKHSLRVQI